MWLGTELGPINTICKTCTFGYTFIAVSRVIYNIEHIHQKLYGRFVLDDASKFFRKHGGIGQLK